MTQKILTMTTNDSGLRSSADSWSGEDSDTFTNKDIGLNPGLSGFYCYDCPLRAMNDGWKLMAPPTRNVYEAGNEERTYEREEYSWWFTK